MNTQTVSLHWQYDGHIAFLGRNGTGKCAGIEVYASSWPLVGSGIPYYYVQLTPYTSKGALARCSIDIPIEQAGALADILQKIYEEYEESLKARGASMRL